MPSGSAVYTVMTTDASPLNAQMAETTGTFNGTVLSLGHIQAGFFCRIEDRAHMASLERALRDNLWSVPASGMSRS